MRARREPAGWSTRGISPTGAIASASRTRWASSRCAMGLEQVCHDLVAARGQRVSRSHGVGGGVDGFGGEAEAGDGRPQQHGCGGPQYGLHRPVGGRRP